VGDLAEPGRDAERELGRQQPGQPTGKHRAEPASLLQVQRHQQDLGGAEGADRDKATRTPRAGACRPRPQIQSIARASRGKDTTVDGGITMKPG
jgi:hypothetical protein